VGYCGGALVLFSSSYFLLYLPSTTSVVTEWPFGSRDIALAQDIRPIDDAACHERAAQRRVEW
jgi:hypothetical protein